MNPSDRLRYIAALVGQERFTDATTECHELLTEMHPGQDRANVRLLLSQCYTRLTDTEMAAYEAFLAYVDASHGNPDLPDQQLTALMAACETAIATQNREIMRTVVDAIARLMQSLGADHADARVRLIDLRLQLANAIASAPR